MVNITAKGLQDYIAHNNPSQQISDAEAKRQKAVPISREFSFEKSDIRRAGGDIYSFYGNCSVNIEAVFSDIFCEQRVIGFTPYEVLMTNEEFDGVKFKISTQVVQAKKKDWR